MRGILENGNGKGIVGERGDFFLAKNTIDRVRFNGHEVKIEFAIEGEQISVTPFLRNPEEFYGNPEVDCLVRFGPTFESLIGVCDKELPGEGVVILEHHFDRAKRLMDEINVLARKTIDKPDLYDDVGFCREYFGLAKYGYDFLRQKEEEMGIERLEGMTLVSLERAGLVSTRLALGVEGDESLENEVRVVTKRVHFKDEPETHLGVTVKWRDERALGQRITGQEIGLCDFVNPASGASAAALMLALRESRPSAVHHRSISLTRQGVILAREAFGSLGIRTTFYSLGEANELNEQYYLVGERVVGDAGHLLRHFLPSWSEGGEGG
jgi:hypothetical protein